MIFDQETIERMKVLFMAMGSTGPFEFRVSEHLLADDSINWIVVIGGNSGNQYRGVAKTATEAFLAANQVLKQAAADRLEAKQRVLDSLREAIEGKGTS